MSRFFSRSMLAVLMGSVIFVPVVARAENAADAGQVLRGFERAVPTVSMPLQVELPAETKKSAETVQKMGQTVQVNRFNIEAKQFSQAELNRLVADRIGKKLSMSELQEAARVISDYYRSKGLMARAYLPKQTIRNGVVTIRVIEGKLGKIKIDPSSETRFDSDLATGLVENRISREDVLHMDDLREGMWVLNDVSGITATASLQSGEEQGETDALIKVSDRPLLSGALQVSDEGMRATGVIRGLATASLNDAMGIGDRFTVTTMESSLSEFGNFSASAPVGTSGLRLGVNGSAMHYRVDEDFNSADQKGHAYTGGVTASYPVFYSANASLLAISSYEFKKLVNSILDTNSSNKNIHVATFGFQAIVMDPFIGGASNNFSGSVSFGDVDLQDNLDDYQQDQATAKTNGMFSKYSASASRLQNLDSINQIFMGVNGQIAPSNLDSSEQISLGGPDGVRAYPNNEGMGSFGAITHFEVRHNIVDGVQLFDFYDAGWVQSYAKTWTGWNTAGAPSDYWLQGFGLGVNWHVCDWNLLSLTVAHTLGNNPGQSNGKNADGYNDKIRAWVKAGMVF